MQNTRISTLFDTIADGLGVWFRNPWRRLSVLIISLLSGNFVGVATSAISGQSAYQDVVIAVLLVVFVEGVSRLSYRLKPAPARSLLVQMLNAFKIGLTYALFLEAFKLGS